MLPSPSSSPRLVLAERTNIIKPHHDPADAYPTPSYHTKRPAKAPDTQTRCKRARLFFHQPESEVNADTTSHDYDKNEDGDVEMADGDEKPAPTLPCIPRPGGFRHMLQASRLGGPRIIPMQIPTRPILQSFVSHSLLDTYTCQAVETNELTLPYACSFTHAAKSGGLPILAVATEQGSVHLFDTTHSRSQLCASGATPKMTLQPHANGVFDLKWRHDDTLIATASGDQTVRITQPVTQRVVRTLHGHTGTVKSVSWSPHHPDLLATGGRDGCLCLWDLRVPAYSRDGVTGRGASPAGPSIKIEHAHGEEKKGPGRRKKEIPRTVTSVLHLPDRECELITGGSFDGCLRKWDIRQPGSKGRKNKKNVTPIVTSGDPTVQDFDVHGDASFSSQSSVSSRARGICSLALGDGPSSGRIFGLGADSRVHAYPLDMSHALASDTFTFSHPEFRSNSFYVRIGTSPCGRWLASGSSGGNVFLWDVSRVSRPHQARSWESASIRWDPAVQLPGRSGEVGALDWAEGCLAACADDGTVRVWRPDVDVLQECLEDPKERAWYWSWANMPEDLRR